MNDSYFRFVEQQILQFSSTKTDCYFNGDINELEKIISKEKAVIITDENINALYPQILAGWKTIVIPAGEAHKQQSTIDFIIHELILHHADRDSILIGLGGGVVTDITGFVACIYMRGIKFGLIPTTILSMVDAAIGGKNGIDVGIYKNLIGIIRHPSLLLFDYSFLKSLPKSEWINGFAEIIKHACIKDKELFIQLKKSVINEFINNNNLIGSLIKRNVQIKYQVVANDEFEKGERKLLNFGHTIGHAIENLYHLPHGHAVSIGMVEACKISEKILGFQSTVDVKTILSKYGLPTELVYDKAEVWKVLLMDKKKQGSNMSFILLPEIGRAIYESIPLEELNILFNQL